MIEYKQFLGLTSKYYSFPINDRCVPDNKQLFCKFVKNVISEMSQNDKIYIHCKGGHGRAGLAAATFLILKSEYKIFPQSALTIIHCAHQERPKMEKNGITSKSESEKFCRGYQVV